MLYDRNASSRGELNAAQRVEAGGAQLTQGEHDDSIRRPFNLKWRVVRSFAWIIRAKVTRGALVAIFSPEGKILLVRSRARDSSRWGLPGGFSKAKEEPVKTAKREVAEETGLHIPLEPFHEVAHYIQWWAWHLDVLYRYDLESPLPADPSGDEFASAPRSLEIGERRWVDLDDPNDMCDVVLTDETTLALSVIKRDTNLGMSLLWFLYYYDGINEHHRNSPNE